MNVYDDCIIYGPYNRKDGRKHIVLIRIDGSKGSVSYPKYLMEVHLNRYLKPNETVDHIDRDFTNNNISNLQVLTRKQHGSIDVSRLKPKAFWCPWCNKLFVADGLKLQRIKGNISKGKYGPFCSRSCAGKHNKSIQLGLVSPKLPEKLVVHYYKINKLR